LPEPLLLALRQRRDQQRLLRAEQRASANVPRSSSSPSPSLIEHVKVLFSTHEPDPRQAAHVYVEAMNDLQDEIEEKHDAFLLYPGMGPMAYITADGHVLVDGRSWDGEEPREATDDEAIGVLVIGATTTGIATLLDLVPSQPAEGRTCEACGGERMAESVSGTGHKMICLVCRGRGWVVPSGLP
jgi:hypothetical protein